MSNTEHPRVVSLFPEQRDQLLGDVERFARAFPALAEHVKTQAKLRYASYLAHIEAGFSETQAFDLCWRLCPHEVPRKRAALRPH